MLLYLLLIKPKAIKVQGAILCTLLFLLFCFGTSCNSTDVEYVELTVLDSIDTEVNAPDVSLVGLSAQSQNGMDSLILFKKGSNKYYLISSNQPKNNQKEVTLPFNIEGSVYQTSDSVYLLDWDKNTIQLFEQKANKITNYHFDSNYFYMNHLLPFKICHNKFIIYQIPKISLLVPSQRLSYFKSKLMAIGTLSGDSISIEPLDFYPPQKKILSIFTMKFTQYLITVRIAPFYIHSTIQTAFLFIPLMTKL